MLAAGQALELAVEPSHRSAVPAMVIVPTGSPMPSVVIAFMSTLSSWAEAARGEREPGKQADGKRCAS